MELFLDMPCVMSRCARAIGTKRQYITLLEMKPLDDRMLYIRVNYRGGFVYAFHFDRRAARVMKVWREVVS